MQHALAPFARAFYINYTSFYVLCTRENEKDSFGKTKEGKNLLWHHDAFSPHAGLCEFVRDKREITLRFFDVLHRNLNSFVQILVLHWNVTGARAGRSFFATRSLTARARPAGCRFVWHAVGVLPHWFVFHFAKAHLVVAVVKRRQCTPRGS